MSAFRPASRSIAGGVVTVRRVANPSGVPVFAGMSQAVEAHGFVFLSGQVAHDASGTVVGVGDARAQAQRIFANIAELLAGHGSNLRHVTKLTCYATSAEVYRAYAEVKHALYPADAPAATTVIVAGLLDPEMLLEVDVIATIPDPASAPTTEETR